MFTLNSALRTSAVSPYGTVFSRPKKRNVHMYPSSTRQVPEWTFALTGGHLCVTLPCEVHEIFRQRDRDRHLGGGHGFTVVDELCGTQVGLLGPAVALQICLGVSNHPGKRQIINEEIVERLGQAFVDLLVGSEWHHMTRESLSRCVSFQAYRACEFPAGNHRQLLHPH